MNTVMMIARSKIMYVVAMKIGDDNIEFGDMNSINRKIIESVIFIFNSGRIRFFIIILFLSLFFIYRLYDFFSEFLNESWFILRALIR